MYFGASSCGPCNRPETIAALKTMKATFAANNKIKHVKFVVVCMDTDLQEGLKFIDKYSDWDEFSIGSWYQNELMMAHVNKARVYAVPHVFVFKDELYDKSAPKIKNRTQLLEVFGGKSIVKWVNEGSRI